MDAKMDKQSVRFVPAEPNFGWTKLPRDDEGGLACDDSGFGVGFLDLGTFSVPIFNLKISILTLYHPGIDL